MRQADRRTCRLEIPADELGEARAFELDAHGAYSALSVAREYCGNRTAALFEDGRRLAQIQRIGPVWRIA